MRISEASKPVIVLEKVISNETGTEFGFKLPELEIVTIVGVSFTAKETDTLYSFKLIFSV
jgi:hypothetical protein